MRYKLKTLTKFIIFLQFKYVLSLFIFVQHSSLCANVYVASVATQFIKDVRFASLRQSMVISDQVQERQVEKSVAY